MPPETPVERPTLFKLSIWINAIWGVISFFGLAILAVLTALGGGIASAFAVTGEEDAIPIALALFVAALAFLFGIAVSAVSIFLSWKAWGMQRFWIWALLIWSCLHGLSSFGVVALITIIGCVQALERVRDGDRPT